MVIWWLGFGAEIRIVQKTRNRWICRWEFRVSVVESTDFFGETRLVECFVERGFFSETLACLGTSFHGREVRGRWCWEVGFFGCAGSWHWKDWAHFFDFSGCKEVRGSFIRWFVKSGRNNIYIWLRVKWLSRVFALVGRLFSVGAMCSKAVVVVISSCQWLLGITTTAIVFPLRRE